MEQPDNCRWLPSLHGQSRTVQGVDATYWREWSKLPGYSAIVAEGFDGPVGFACGAPFGDGSYRIGPLYADSFDIAMGLMKTLIDQTKDRNEKFENIKY